MEQILEKEKRIYLHCAVLHFTLIVGSIDVTDVNLHHVAPLVPHVEADGDESCQ